MTSLFAWETSHEGSFTCPVRLALSSPGSERWLNAADVRITPGRDPRLP